MVIDEAHENCGVFGSNVALILRRLKRITNFYGTDPEFILSSATLANPVEFSQLLVGKKFQPIDQDTSASGTKHMVFYIPLCNVKKYSIYLNRIKPPKTIKIRITTHIHGFNSHMMNKEIININKSNIRTPAIIMIMTPTVAIMKTATAEPNISPMA